MEVVDSNLSNSGVEKSSTAIAESSQEEVEPSTIKKEEIVSKSQEKVVVTDKVPIKEESVEEEVEEAEEVEEGEEEEEPTVEKYEEKVIVAQKPPLPTSIVHQQSQEEQYNQQQRDDIPKTVPQQQHYQMQQPQDDDKPTSLPATFLQQRYQQPLLQQQQQQQQHQVSSTTSREESHDDGYSRKTETIERSEIQQSSTSSTTKTVDLQKIFTPATDYEEILPKNRKLYSSSAFYSPNLHPTVEDQVELARRISHSLSDISNQQSKGQSMYVNRKKRSVKWVHEGEGQGQIQDYSGYHHAYEGHKENEYERSYHDKLPLKLVMNPRGQVRDFTSVRQDYSQESSGLLSPDKCAELVAGLNAPKGKGAELFAKRRKKSEKWIVDETNAAQQSPSGVQPYGTISPNILPAYSDVGVQRVQLNMHQDQVQDKYAQPRIKMIKTPWEAALETGSASAAFQELPNLKQPASFVPQQSTGYDYSNYTPITFQQQSEPNQQKYHSTQEYQQFSQTQQQKSWQPNSQRDLAYKPSIPQGWNAPPTTLPKELYVPKEIPLDGYKPPSTEKYLPSNLLPYSGSLQSGTSSLYNQQQQQLPTYPSTDYSSTLYQQENQQLLSSSIGSGGIKNDTNDFTNGNNYGYNYCGTGLSTSPVPKHFPISQQYSSSYLAGNDNASTQIPRSVSPYYQTPSVSGGVAATASTFNNNDINTFPISQKPANYYSAPPINKPINNWRTQPNLANHPSPVAFNPSPLPYEKLAKFQQPDPYENNSGFRVPIPGIRRPLAVPSGCKIRNLSPLPYISASTIPTKSYSNQQSTTTKTTTTKYQTSHDNFTQQYTDNCKYSSTFGCGGDGGSNGYSDIIGQSPIINNNKSKIDLSHCHNYNTSARGWGQTKNSYKPMTFTKSPIAADMPYTDF